MNLGPLGWGCRCRTVIWTALLPLGGSTIWGLGAWSGWGLGASVREPCSVYGVLEEPNHTYNAPCVCKFAFDMKN